MKDYQMRFISFMLGILVGAATVAYAVRHQPKIIEHAETTVYECSSNKWVVAKPKIQPIRRGINSTK